MAGFQIPLELEIDFLKNIVIPSFSSRLQHANEDARTAWMREEASDAYGPRLEHLIRAFSAITSKEEAEAKLEKAEAEAKLKEEREYQLRLLQQQSQQVANSSNTTIETVIANLEDIKAQQQKILEFQQGKGPPPLSSAAALISTALATLLHQYDVEFAGGDGDSILTTVQITDFNSIKKENEYVMALTPIFQLIFQENHLWVVNSENFPWLQSLKTPLKPDLFLAPNWVYTKRIPSNPITDSNFYNPNYNYLYGGVYTNALYDCLYIIDCKLTYTNEALGELLVHLQHLNYYSNIPHKQSKGMLFGKYGCHLMVCQGQELIYREFVKWETPGSQKRLKEFFIPVKWNLSPMLERFQLQIVEPQADQETAFLGSGGFGRVVRVADNSGLHYALKVVESKNFDHTLKEFTTLTNHTTQCGCPLIASIPTGYEFSEMDDLCGFILSPVGTGLTRDNMTTQLIERVVMSLRDLHQHNPPYIHGDARISNVILTPDGSLTWIDFMNCICPIQMDLSHSFRNDMTLLIESIVTNPKIDQTLIFNYGEDPSQIQPIINFLNFEMTKRQNKV